MNKQKNANILIILALVLFVIAAWEFIIILKMNILFEGINQTDTLQNVIINLISPAIISVFLLISFNCLNPFESRNESNGIAIYDNHTKLKWDKLLNDAKKVDLSVVYYDKWFIKYEDILLNFVQNKGKIRIVLPDINNDTVITHYATFFPSYSKKSLIEFIIATKTRIETLFEGYQESYEIVYSNLKMNYFLCLIDDKQIIFSHYECNKNTGGKSPCFIFDRSQMTFNFNQFWEDEFNYLFDVLTPKDI